MTVENLRLHRGERERGSEEGMEGGREEGWKSKI
jgi:hypothetical protein